MSNSIISKCLLTKGYSAVIGTRNVRSFSKGSKYDVVVIGGGIVGAASARELLIRYPDIKIALLEKEHRVAHHQSGSNSGVIHAGIYYKPGSLKAKLCVQGHALAYEYCDKKNIPYLKCGKLIVATERSEVSRLLNLYERGQRNGVKDMELMDKQQMKEIEPHCEGLQGIWSPHTGIVNWGKVTESFVEDFVERGGHKYLNFEVRKFAEAQDSDYPIIITDEKGQEVRASHVLTCCGLHSDTIAVLTGCPEEPKIIPFRGEYLYIVKEKSDIVKANIYPVPDPRFPFLGVHLTPRIDGRIIVGPNAILAFAKEGYKWGDINMQELKEIFRFHGFRKVAMKYAGFGMKEMARSWLVPLQVAQLRKFVLSLTTADVKDTHIHGSFTHNHGQRPLDQLELKQNVIEEFDEIDESRTISIQYKYHSQLENEVKEEIMQENEEENVVEPTDYSDLSIANSRQLAIGTQINDLQSVLIMMAMNSNSNEDEEPDMNETRSDLLRESPENPEDLVLISNSIQKEARPDFLNITQMKIIVTDRQRILMNKYIKKWRNYVNKRKEYIAQQRQEAINNFFEKLEKKKTDLKNPNEVANKSKQLARDYSTYQHRYKMQKHIIALQKAKLEEQNRMIDELKYNKIIEASKHSVDAMKEEVRRTYFEMDRNLKPKIKLLTNELKIQEIEEPSLVLHCLKVPQFLQRMEKRAREREEKHAMIRERRKQMEEERIRLKQQAELAKLEMDKEEKFKRIKELREKRKKERMESIRKKQYADRMRSLIVMADLHYERTLMAKYCIRPLKKLMELKRDNMEKAKAHYKFQLKKNVFLHWMFYTEDMWMERNYKAEKFYRTKILKLIFAAFKENHHEYVLQKQVAEDYYDLYVTQLIFRKLREGIAVIKKEIELKMEKAKLYHNRNLLFKILTCWRTLPALNAIKREQEARKARWREKVLQVVPDYTPPEE
ncbi:hypothetical protein MSG28_006098 [Choristoneura fumiferana]|uniref:Uncharacterized protein n=1 Tax=Choristoneura fumiferana TaxID=7141 RepID=A0ACC0JDP1_CHOFU|nr:hypothetical protein MSG28_006098 [Choristoneura fumiferana]